MKRMTRTSNDARGQRGFTLSELIVAIAAVALITLGIASVFQSTSETIRIGRASAELDTLASAIERVMRRDFENINQDGFLVIRNRRLDVQGHGPRRADEIAFFVNGNFTSAQHSTSVGGVGSHVQSRVSRVYYGHGVQLGTRVTWPIDPSNPGSYDTTELYSELVDNALGVPGGLNANPDKWAYLRQPLVLTENITGRLYLDSLFKNYSAHHGVGGTDVPPPLASGLVDIARADMGENTSYVMTQTGTTDATDANFSTNLLVWNGQETDRQMIMRMAQMLPHARRAETYPDLNWISDHDWRSNGLSWRGEIVPTGLSRNEMMLTRSTLAVGVSGCAIEWSYDGVRFFGLDSNIHGNIVSPYPYRLFDKGGRPLETGLLVPIDRITVPDPVNSSTSKNYTAATGLECSERVFGFGMPSIDYLRNRSWWSSGGIGGASPRIRNTEVPGPAEFDPAFFNPDLDGAVGSDADLWYLPPGANDWLPDRVVIPLPRMVRVTLTLSDHNGEFTDIPYTFTFEVPQPPRLRPSDPGTQDGYTDVVGGGA